MREPKAHSTAENKLDDSSTQTDVEEMVRRRAYELYEKRGDSSGDAVTDWLQAEQEIAGSTGEQTMKAAA